MKFTNKIFEPNAFGNIRNTTRCPDMTNRRHINKKSARKGNMRGNTRPFGPHCLFFDLNEDFIPFFQKLFDLSINPLSWFAPFLFSRSLIIVLIIREIFDDIRCMKKSSAIKADIDKCSLHTRKDTNNFSLVDIADNPFVTHALDEKLRDNSVFETSNPGFT